MTKSPSSLRTYVLDTSVLLSDPGALRRFAEHEVVLPVVVITELEGKRHHPELGYFARQALRLLDELRVEHGRLTSRCRSATHGGTLRVELNHTDPAVAAVRLPARRQRHPDPRRARATSPTRASDVTLVSKDLPLRVKAVRGRAGRRGVPRASDVDRLRLDRHGRARGRRPTTSTSCTTTAAIDLDGGARPAVPHRAGAALRARHGAGPGQRRTSSVQPGPRRPRGVRHPRPLAPSSGSRWTCCSTPRSASCRSAAGPAPASRRWRCARASRRCWSAASTRRSSCSGRCTRSAARSSATCPAPSRRRCRPGRRRSSTPSGAITSPRSSTRCSTAACSRCCR